MRWIAIFVPLVLVPASAVAADEAGIELKQAPGADITAAHCGACHSLDYILMNSFLEPAKWDAEVTKMIKAYTAPISPEDAKTISDYLKENYAK
ncbi:MAG: cytochrome c [Alphaproteobacteria bacterium]|nr:cytochrome c [Alphaproteobacteria bacterium]MCL2453431.1 cytochrome c [Alphaproteobacteria bacterium]